MYMYVHACTYVLSGATGNISSVVEIDRMISFHQTQELSMQIHVQIKIHVKDFHVPWR
jgi:hypothetical protein